MRLNMLLPALVAPMAIFAPTLVLAKADVSPKLVYAERYLEKGWYRDAWGLLEPMLPQEDKGLEDVSPRLLVASIEALYGLNQVGEAMVWVEKLNRLESSGKMTLSEDQAQRRDKVYNAITERFGVLRFDWPDEGAGDLKPIQAFTLEWDQEAPQKEEDIGPFTNVQNRLAREGIAIGDKVYLPKGKVTVDGIWKVIGDEEQVFKVSAEKPPKAQRANNGDGLGFAIGFQGLPGYRGPDYEDLYWQDTGLDPEDPAYVGISTRRYGLVSLPRMEFSATHSLITQGWREIGLKGYFGYSPGLGSVGNIPDGDVDEDLPAASPFFNVGLMTRQSFHASGGILMALSVGVQGLYTPKMRFVAQGVDAGDSPYCVDSTTADLFIVDRKTIGAGVLGSFEASKGLESLNARFGVETTAGYNLAAPLPANRLSVDINRDDLPDDLDGNEICFEDEGIVLGGFDLRAQFFFRVALW